MSVSGTGTVTSSPSGISCPSTCSVGFTYGTTVTLTASPSTGYTFSGWSGACSGAGTCALTMNGAKSVGATFTPLPPQTLTVSASGSGTVTSSPSGISCPGTCSAAFSYGTVVDLTASPSTGYVFAGWSGACSGTGTCALTMNGVKSVTAVFTLPSRDAYVAHLWGWQCYEFTFRHLLPGHLLGSLPSRHFGHAFGFTGQWSQF